ncbi:MAG TPA: hypothetical protein VK726_04015 [Acetobacteraceae bacterium]|nr:hypothetical protein [Acetobacteraceae bacterium]
MFQAAFDTDHVLVDMQITLGRAEYVAGVADLGRRLILGSVALSWVWRRCWGWVGCWRAPSGTHAGMWKRFSTQSREMTKLG